MFVSFGLFHVWIFSAQLSQTFGFDYCAIKSCPQTHTMCIYKNETGELCKGMYTGLIDGMRHELVRSHNNIRAKVARGEAPGQPPASNMMKVTWNKELEMIAQRWCDQCPEQLAHDQCRVSKDGTSVGQNLALNALDIKIELDKKRELACNVTVNKWYQEVEFMPASVVDRFSPQGKNGKAIDNYTQLVWADTKEIGCGFAIKKPDDNELYVHFNHFYLFCNYKPSGNDVRAKLYKRGNPCSACPKGTACSKSFPGLCTSDKSDHGPAPSPSGWTGHQQPLFVLALAPLVLLVL